jgi:thioester reductase-like protein
MKIYCEKTNIEGTANIVILYRLSNKKKLCFVSSIATLGDLLPHEKFITEETNGIRKSTIMIMLFLNMVPK